MTRHAHLLVIAKAPRPGRSKTRLSPTLTPDEAANVAAACLADTLAAVSATPATRRTLVLDGPAPDWLSSDFDVLPQIDGSFAARLETAFDQAFQLHEAPMLLIGMDTPQVTPGLLTSALDRLDAPGTDAVLGPAADGGWWALGLHRPAAGLFAGIPMSTADTGAAQLARLAQLGLTTAALPELRDIDLYSDLCTVAADLPPGSEVATLTRSLTRLSA